VNCGDIVSIQFPFCLEKDGCGCNFSRRCGGGDFFVRCRGVRGVVHYREQDKRFCKGLQHLFSSWRNFFFIMGKDFSQVGTLLESFQKHLAKGIIYHEGILNSIQGILVRFRGTNLFTLLHHLLEYFICTD